MKRLAVAHLGTHVAYKQHHGRGILERRVHAHRSIGGTRPARHKTHTGAVGQLAMRLGHVGRATLLPVDDELDLVAVQVKAVQHRQVTFTWYPEHVADALGNQAFDQQVAADFGGGRGWGGGS